MLRRFLVGWVSVIVGLVAADLLLGDRLTMPEQTSNLYWSTSAGFAFAFAFLVTYVRPLVTSMLGPLGCLLTFITLGSVHLVSAAALFWLALQLPLAISVIDAVSAIWVVLIISGCSIAGSQLLGAGRRGRAG